jgi:hypothetical protein
MKDFDNIKMHGTTIIKITVKENSVQQFSEDKFTVLFVK